MSGPVVELSRSVRDAEWVAVLRAAETAARRAQAVVLGRWAAP